jgi:hypothetical protein
MRGSLAKSGAECSGEPPRTGGTKDIYNGRIRDTSDYLSLWGQNIIAGTEIGLAADIEAFSGTTATVIAGGVAGAGWDALTFNGEAKSWGEFGKGQVKGAITGAATSLVVLKVAAPIARAALNTPAGKMVVEKAADLGSKAI